MRKLIIGFVCLLTLPLLAQTVNLTVTKSGDDVVLTYTGGSGPYIAVKARRPAMGTRRIVIDASATSATTDTGAAADGLHIWYYQVSEATGPSITVSSPSADFASPTPCTDVTGTMTGATHVYVNGVEATINGSDWTATAVPLCISGDPLQGDTTPITIAAVDANGNWTLQVVTGTYTGDASTTTAECIARKAGE